MFLSIYILKSYFISKSEYAQCSSNFFHIVGTALRISIPIQTNFHLKYIYIYGCAGENMCVCVLVQYCTLIGNIIFHYVFVDSIVKLNNANHQIFGYKRSLPPNETMYGIRQASTTK